MKVSSFEQFLVLKKNKNVFVIIIIIIIIINITVDGARSFEQTLNPVTTVGST